MSKLQLSVAVGNYDRVRPLMDGAVQIDGVDPIFMNLPPEEIFFRAFRSQDFDICELSMSSFTVKTADRNCPYIGVPAFVSRAFRHNSIYVRKDRIKSPADPRCASDCRNFSLPPAYGAHHPRGRLWVVGSDRCAEASSMPAGRSQRQAGTRTWRMGARSPTPGAREIDARGRPGRRNPISAEIPLLPAAITHRHFPTCM